MVLGIAMIVSGLALLAVAAHLAALWMADRRLHHALVKAVIVVPVRRAPPHARRREAERAAALAAWDAARAA
jgi:hypothetical protein